MSFYHILENNQEIANKILTALAEVIGPHFSTAVDGIREDVSAVVKETISSSPEMQSLLGGTLQFDIGLPPGQAVQVVDIFAQAIAANVVVKYKNVKKSGRKLKGGITIEIQPLAYQNIPNIPLQWDLTSGQQADVKTLLLEAGDSILVFGYDIQYGPFGRSGGARMSRHADESWGMSAGVSRVPPSFSGTRSNNFISRALKNKDFESKLSAVLVKRLSK